jgi:YgiT-type zinc finger domain-containing protein
MSTTTLESKCPVCGGAKQPGMTTYTVDFGTGLVVVRHVPAMVCDQCGEDWIAPAIARRLEQMVKQAREGGAEVEVLTMGAA